MATITPPGMVPPALASNVVLEPDMHKISEELELRQAVYGAAGEYSVPLRVVVDPGVPDDTESPRVGTSGLTVKAEELTIVGVPFS
jgi:hypothetical protein